MTLQKNTNLKPGWKSINIVRTSLAWFPVLLYFFTYPLAVFTPVETWTSLVFGISLPSFFLLSLVGIGYLLVTPQYSFFNSHSPPRAGWNCLDNPRVVFSLITLFAALCIAGAILRDTARWQHVVEFIGYAAFPVYIAVCPRSLLPRKLPLVFALLWGLHVFHGLWQQYGTGFQVVTLSGNVNWAAPVLVGLAPWPVLGLWKLTAPDARPLRERVLSLRAGSVRALCFYIGTALAIILAGVLAYHTGCRATVLAVGGYVLLFVFLPRLAAPGKVVLIGALILSAEFAVLSYPSTVSKQIRKDIRLPLFASTVKMIADHPGLGVGPGNYRRDFASYRTPAQRVRKVAAPVTEHPHNEILNVFSQAGVLGGLLWLPIVLVVLLPPPRRRLFWYAVHFTAFIIVAHAMFDKALIQPPVNLIGFFMIGLLWRPRLRIRATPSGRGPFRRVLAVTFAISAAAYGATVAVQDVRTDYWVRRARISEFNKNPKAAYQSFRKAAGVQPAKVRPAMLAGLTANKLGLDPGIALRYFKSVQNIEPNYAHLNGEIGLALSRLGRHSEAHRYYLKEIRFYPFQVKPHKRLYSSSLFAGRTEHLSELSERIRQLWVRDAGQSLEQEELRKLCRHWLDNLQTDSPRKTREAANATIQNTFVQKADPDFHSFGVKPELTRALARSNCSQFDYGYWHRLHIWKSRIAAKIHEEAPEALLKRFRAYWNEHGADEFSSKKSTAAASLFSDARYPARAFAECARQAGYQAAIVGSGFESTGYVQLRDEHRFWLVKPKSGQVWSDLTVKDLRTSSGKREKTGLGAEAAQQLSLLVPVHPLDFCLRSQALASIVGHYHAEQVPVFGEPPALRLHQWQNALSTGETLLQRESLTEGADFRDRLVVTYDKIFFREAMDVYKAVSTDEQRNRKETSSRVRAGTGLRRSVE